MQRDFWIYQKRQNGRFQWALYVVLNCEKHLPNTVTLDFTLYSDAISNSAKSVSFGGEHRSKVSAYVNDIVSQLVEFTSVTNGDYTQLEEELLAILQHV